jgi:hypothetical protein
MAAGCEQVLCRYASKPCTIVITEPGQPVAGNSGSDQPPVIAMTMSIGRQWQHCLRALGQEIAKIVPLPLCRCQIVREQIGPYRGHKPRKRGQVVGIRLAVKCCTWRRSHATVEPSQPMELQDREIVSLVRRKIQAVSAAMDRRAVRQHSRSAATGATRPMACGGRTSWRR